MSEPDSADRESGPVAKPKTDKELDMDRLIFDFAVMKAGDAIGKFREAIGAAQRAIANLSMLAEYVGRQDRSLVFNDSGEPDAIYLESTSKRNREAVRDYLESMARLWRDSTDRGLTRIALDRLDRLCRRMEGTPAVWIGDHACAVVTISNLRRQWHRLERANETLPIGFTREELRRSALFIRRNNPLNGGRPFDMALYSLAGRAVQQGFTSKQIATALVDAGLGQASDDPRKYRSRSRQISAEIKRVDSFLRRLSSPRSRRH